MKERIVVKNFSVIDSIEMDVKPFTILIGPQSSGKSLMAKLVYFFKNIPVHMASAVINDCNKRQLEGMLRYEFNRIFPEYLLKCNEFSVTFFYDDKEISITNEGAKTYKSYKFFFSRSILSRYNALKREYKKNRTSFSKTPDFENHLVILSKKHFEFFYGVEEYLPFFIPAGRSYYANIKNSIFSILSKDIDIDYMLKLFGGVRENLRDSYALADKKLKKMLIRFFSKIIGGEYRFDKEKEWIQMMENRIVFLKDSSSGQQEVIPLIVSLAGLINAPANSVYAFIEEPEAHLFPESQNIIVDFLALQYNIKKRSAGFFITTHSPYILAFFNNLIQGENSFNEITALFEKGDIDMKTKDKRLKALDKLVTSGTRIDFDDVAVYEVKEGTCKDIKNYEHKLIDATVIDEVSNKTARTFDGLLDIAYGE